MDWLILVLGVPAILIPLVLLLGFAGCPPSYVACVDDSDCPVGTHCENGSCIANEPDRPSAPESLHAISRDDHSVSLTWTNTDPAATDFQIERTEDGDNFDQIDPSNLSNLSSTGATARSPDLHEGVTYIYRVSAVLDGQVSEQASDPSSATVFPRAPVNLRVTGVGIDHIDLSWRNASTIATEFFVEENVPGSGFQEIPGSRGGPGTTFS